MSEIIKGEITCPKCSNTQGCSSYSSINVSLSPELKSRFLSNEWNLFRCDHCGASIPIVSDMMYHDMVNQFIVWYIPNGDVDQKVQSLNKYNHLLGEGGYLARPIIVKNREDAILMVHLCDKNGPPISKEKERDYFEMIKAMRDLYENTLNHIKQYPTLNKYQPEIILKTVKKLQEKYPDMTEEQCLLNLEMDLSEQEQLATGK